MAWSRAEKGSPNYAIMVADPSDPKSRRVAWQGTGSVSPADISADGRQILVTRSISNRETQLLLVDLPSGQAREITWSRAGPARYEEPQFTRDGGKITAITNAGSDVRRLVEIDLATGRATPISPELKWDVETYETREDGRLIAYAVNEEGFSRLFMHDRASGRSTPVAGLPRGVLTGLGFSPDGKQLAASLSTATTAGDVWSYDLEGGKLTRWTTSEVGELDPLRLAEPELIRFKSFDGLSVPAFVYRPKQALAGKRTPVIIDIHGGPESQTRPSWNPGAQYFADTLGATVILPNVRGSDGYGTRFLNLDNGPLRENSVRDIGALLDWIKTQGDLDASRVAVYGQSYGGYMSLASMIHFSDRLVGGVERYGISDFTTFLKNTEAYRRDNRRAEYGDERDPAMLKVFQRISPLRNVTRIKKPMLVMQGANDPRVPQSESDQVVAGIRSNRIPAGYVVFADEGHGFLKKHNNDLRREVETVFLKQLFEGK
jgi:dipeptidyl aminopeptidase/acylaminoacyl peptidase